MRNYIKKTCPVCNKEFSILHGKDGSSNKIYCSIKCSDEARRKRNKTIKGKMKSKRVTKKHIRNWKPIEPDGVPESDIWYRPAEPVKPSGKQPKVCCNISTLPKPYLQATKDFRPIREEQLRCLLQEKRKNSNFQKGTRKIAYTQEDNEKIMRLRSEGKTAAEIAIELGKTKGAIQAQILRLNGTRGNGSRRRYTQAQDNVIRVMRREGKSFEEIADQLGRTKEAVRKRYNMIGG